MITTTWYRVKWMSSLSTIDTVPVTRSSEKTIWTYYSAGFAKPEERRHVRFGDFESYFPTYAEAYNHVLSRSQQDIEKAKMSLDCLTKVHEQLKEKLKPSES